MDPKTEATVRLTCFAGVFFVMALAEWLLPRRKLTARKLPRWGSNLALVVLNTVAARFLIPLTAVTTAMSAQSYEFGLLNLFSFSVIVKVVLAVAFLDFAIYLQHVLFHAIPIFWKLHRVHHADLDLDVTSGLRFHTLEILLSALIKLGVIGLLGAPPLAVVIFEVVLNATAMFNHSNVHLPLGLDRVLRLVLVTPDMHRVHHSVDRSETNSNFGFNLPWWDYFFGTYCDQPALGHEQMVIGMAEVRDEQQACRLPAMLTMPFIKLKRPPEADPKDNGPAGKADEKSTAEKKRPRRKWFQFSLRTLLLMMLVFGCGLGWFTAKRRQAQQAWKRISDAEKLNIVLSAADDNHTTGHIWHEGTWLEERLGIALPSPLGFAEVYISRNLKPVFQELAKFPELTGIWLEVEYLTDEQLETFADEKRLTTFQIAWSPLRGTGLSNLAGNDSLEQLRLLHCENLTDEAIYSIPKLPSLTQLKIENCPLTGVSLGHLATACPKLETLILNEVPLTLEGLQEIGTIHSLKSLTLDESGVTSDGLGYLDDLTQLQEISFYGAFINDLGLEHLSKHPHLEHLPLQKTAITDAGMTHVSVLQELKSVNLEDTLITDQGLQQLQSRKLETLRLNYTSITDAGVSQLTRFNHLRFLRLSRTKITDACIPELAKLPLLEVLALDKTAITDDALSSLSHHRSLKALILPQKLKGTPGVNALQQNNPGMDISFL
ncbi:MAG: sterol desaturase family protein [Planctomycetaceae bacterium]